MITPRNWDNTKLRALHKGTWKYVVRWQIESYQRSRTRYQRYASAYHSEAVMILPPLSPEGWLTRVTFAIIPKTCRRLINPRFLCRVRVSSVYPQCGLYAIASDVSPAITTFNDCPRNYRTISPSWATKSQKHALEKRSEPVPCCPRRAITVHHKFLLVCTFKNLHSGDPCWKLSPGKWTAHVKFSAYLHYFALSGLSLIQIAYAIDGNN